MEARPNDNRRILMIGPALHGRGGISRVVLTWHESGFFLDQRVDYVATTARDGTGRITATLAAIIVCIYKLPRSRALYAHTATGGSFYRKSLFILLAKIFKRRVILHVHPTTFFDKFVPGTPGLRGAYIRYIVGLVDHFVVLTQRQLGQAKALRPLVPAYMLPNPVDVNSYAPNDAVARVDGQLLYLGWYIREKGVFDLVDAVSILVRKGHAVKVQMHGTKEADALRRYVDSKGLSDVVAVGDWVGMEGKVDALRRASIFVFPSHSEGVPNAILEAMASGAAIVSTAVGGLAEVLRDRENALICKAAEPAHLAEKLEAALRDSNLRARLGAKAVGDAREKYDLPVVRAEFNKVIGQL